MKRSLDRDGRVQLTRDPAERAPLLKRLRKVEGQVRGLIEMIEADRYCGDELQQLSAARAALREIAVLLATQHIEAAAKHGIDTGKEASVMRDIEIVLRATLRHEQS